ncbi:microfibrillar-associated protein 2 isoform X3 [Struthio camelus]|uniref:microfibrillar-associated protein 2 isoform X3 n=1 Tax=Struthio camelus TaxID=8801 RepID=UPI003603F8D6
MQGLKPRASLETRPLRAHPATSRPAPRPRRCRDHESSASFPAVSASSAPGPGTVQQVRRHHLPRAGAVFPVRPAIRNSRLLRLSRCDPARPRGAVSVPVAAAIPAGGRAGTHPSCRPRDGAHGAGTAGLPGGAVPLHQALLGPQALQAVPERDLLLQPPPGLRDQQGDLRPHRVRPRRAAASRPVPRQVLQVRGDGHQRALPDRGRLLRPQLRRLLSSRGGGGKTRNDDQKPKKKKKKRRKKPPPPPPFAGPAGRRLASPSSSSSSSPWC